MMTLTKRKHLTAVHTPEGENNPEHQLATLRERAKVLRAQERDAFASDHAPQGAPRMDHVDLERRVAKLLAGEPIKLDEYAPPLVQIQTELWIVTAAVEKLERELHMAKARRVQREFQEDGRAWRETVRATALSIAQLQGLNRKRMAMAGQLKQGTLLTLPCEFPATGGRLLGLGEVQMANDGGSYEYLRQVVAAGICTQAEIEQARANASK